MTAYQIRNPDGTLNALSDTRTLQDAKNAKIDEMNASCAKAMEEVYNEYQQIVAGMDLGTDAVAVKAAMAPYVTQKETLISSVNAAIDIASVDAIVWSNPA